MRLKEVVKIILIAFGISLISDKLGFAFGSDAMSGIILALTAYYMVFKPILFAIKRTMRMLGLARLFGLHI